MKITYVDGYKIRQTLDPDFNIIGFGGFDPLRQNRRPYIPEKEIWFDRRFKSEKKFILLVEMAPKTKKRSSKKRFVDEERYLTNKRFIKKGEIPKFTLKTEKRNEVLIKHIHGSIVRQYIDPDFVFGGHGYVYSYIPKNEVWLDALMDPCDLPHVLCHELVEMRLMKDEKKSYITSHEYATIVEKENRRKYGGVYPGDDAFPRSWTHSFLIKYYEKQHNCLK